MITLVLTPQTCCVSTSVSSSSLSLRTICLHQEVCVPLLTNKKVFLIQKLISSASDIKDYIAPLTGLEPATVGSEDQRSTIEPQELVEIF